MPPGTLTAQLRVLELDGQNEIIIEGNPADYDRAPAWEAGAITEGQRGGDGPVQRRHPCQMRGPPPDSHHAYGLSRQSDVQYNQMWTSVQDGVEKLARRALKKLRAIDIEKKKLTAEKILVQRVRDGRVDKWRCGSGNASYFTLVAHLGDRDDDSDPITQGIVSLSPVGIPGAPTNLYPGDAVIFQPTFALWWWGKQA